MCALQCALIARVGDDNLWRGIGDDVSDFVCAQSRVDRYQNCTEARGRPIKIDEFEIVLRQERDAVACCDPSPNEADGQAFDASSVIRMRDSFVLKDESRAVRVKLCVTLNDVAKCEIAQPHWRPPKHCC